MAEYIKGALQKAISDAEAKSQEYGADMKIRFDLSSREAKMLLDALEHNSGEGSRENILRFSGYSDDTLEEHFTGESYDNCASMKPIQCIVDCGKKGRLMVVGQYGKASGNGCWMIGVAPVTEEEGIPDWNIRFESGAGYSPVLCVEIPNGPLELKWMDGGKERK